MPLRFQLSQILKLAVIQSTFLVPLTIIGGGIASGEYFKALFYALGILILGPIQSLVSAMIGHSRMRHGAKSKSGTPLYSTACDMFAIWAGSDYTCPAWSSTLLAFSFTYLIVPMGINGYVRPFLWTLMGLYLLMDGLVRWKTLQCYASGAAGLVDVGVGIAFGGVMGALWWLIISRLADGDFTFFNQPASNRLMCDKPRKKHMKCTVYKDGVKTGSIIK